MCRGNVQAGQKRSAARLDVRAVAQQDLQGLLLTRLGRRAQMMDAGPALRIDRRDVVPTLQEGSQLLRRSEASRAEQWGVVGWALNGGGVARRRRAVLVLSGVKSGECIF